ncbi:MAG: PKD domain-containing protein [Candidatus Cloacimonadales bacterium]|nr:PKD domain-containing protein [Candidatus Cloacimonadales bacterium]
MKALAVFFLLLLGQLFCTVSFQYQFDLPKYDPQDELKQILLFDLDNNGSDEIVITYTNSDIFRIVVYNQSGTILDSRDYAITENYQYHKIHFVRLFNTLYFVANINLTQIAGNQVSRYCNLQVIDWQPNTIVDEISFLIGQYTNYGYSSYNFSTHLIKDKLWGSGAYLFLGISKIHHWGDEFDSGSSYLSRLYQILFNGYSLSLMNEFDDNGTSVRFIDNSTFYSSGYHSSSSSVGMGQAWDGSRAYYVKELSYFNSNPVQTVFSASGNFSGDYMSNTIYNHYPGGFRLLKQYNDPWNYGYPFYFYRIDSDGNSYVFANYDQNSNAQLWESDFSELRNLGYGTELSSTINTNQGNQFVLYFGSKYPDLYYLEIRDLISGEYVIAEEAPFLPITILKNENDDNLYFISSNSGCDVYVTDPISFPSIIPHFTCSDTLSYSPFIADFTDHSFGNISTWEWDFNNDGIIDSYDQNPEWTFYQTGYYSVSLTISDGTNSETIIKDNLIRVLPPEASFTLNTAYGVVPLAVSFTDASIENVVSWEWDFENDGVIDSNDQNPTWIYDDIGIYSVSLTVSDGTNNDTYLLEDCIEILPFILEFDSDPHVGWIPVIISFEDLTEGIIDSWEWDLDGDGNIDSYEQNPEWTYNEIGWYDISLTVTNSFDSQTLTKENFIHTLFVHTGAISENTLWDVDTVSVMSSIIIEEDATLTISPGVTVLLPISCTIDIRGNIIAEGTENDSIYFIPYNSTWWKSIIFDYTPEDADSTIFKFCSFQYSVAFSHSNNNPTRGGAIYFDDFSKAKISNSSFIGNEAEQGGAIYLDATSPVIDNCTFYDNLADEGGAVYCYNSLTEFNNCKILSNRSDWGAIYLRYSRNSIKNTIFANNLSDYGGGLYSYHLNPQITNCVFWNNDAVYYNLGASIYLCESYPTIKNSVFWHSIPGNATGQIYLADDECLPIFDYCNIQSGFNSFSGNGSINYPDSLFTNNIDENPEFQAPTVTIGLTNEVWDADWMLTTSSPCIDAGNPDPVYNDPEDFQNPGLAFYPALGTITNDMGVYGGPNTAGWYFTGIKDYEIKIPPDHDILGNYPNPFNPSTTIAFSSEFCDQEVTIKIFNIKGQIVQELKPGIYSNIVIWDGNDLIGKPVSSGIYYYSLFVNRKNIASQKCLLIK